jgi:hypothetical protein
VARKPSRTDVQQPIAEVVASLTREQLADVVFDAAGRHEDVARAVRLVAARAKGDLGTLRTEVDRALRTRRFLGYWEGMEWARAAQPVVAELERAARTAPSRDLVELLQRAIGHVVKVIHQADDSSGLIGDLVRDLLELHAVACDAGVADPVKLAGWMIRFRFSDQDFFEVDPVRYQEGLGDAGLAAYREAVEAIDDAGSFGVRYARERLAVLDRDIETIVKLAGGDLSNAYQFFRVAEAMAELGRDDLVLEWTARGIVETTGWQVGTLYDLACETYARLGQPLEVLRLRRSQHERMPALSTYSTLRKAAEEVSAWDVEREAARSRLRACDLRGFVGALLGDGDQDLAWDEAVAAPADEIDADLWLRLAEAREASHPADALAVYTRVADEVLVETDRRAYSRAVRILKRARAAATAAGRDPDFTAHISRLREQHRRRPTLIAMLDKAKLD